MKFFSDIRLLVLAIWLGAGVFFIGVAQSAFAVIADRELAGAVVGRNLTILNIAGIVIAAIVLLTSFIGLKHVSKFWVWLERLLVLVVGAACAVGQFVIGLWIAAIKAQAGKPIEELAADDPLKVQFNNVHLYSEWTLMAAMIAALLACFIISNRKFGTGKDGAADIYDFSKEFKV